MKIGIVGCGKISGIYLKNTGDLFDNLDVVALADLNRSTAESKAGEFGIETVLSPDELLSHPEIEAVVNLTIPAAHTEVSRAALNAGKHVYLEKPFALDMTEAAGTLELARTQGLRIGSAPDTFLGAGLQLCRRLIDEGAIGEPVAANAVMNCHGHESWHPTPGFYYKAGGGPMLDMGPYYLTALVSLLGPAVSVAAITGRAFEERVVTSEPRRGERISVEVNTHQIGTIRFTGGAAASISMSFDVWKTDQPRLEIHGTEGSLSCPDPNNFGGSVKLYRPGMEDWEIRRTGHLPYRDNSRGLGLSEMVSAIGEKRPHRASGELAVHVLDTMLAFDRSSAEGRQIELTSTCNQPAVIQV